MNVVDFAFQLLHIYNCPTLFVLIPLRSPCTPSIDNAHFFIDCENTFGDCTDFFVDCAHNFDDYANTLDNRTNNVVDSADMPNISSIDLCTPNPILIQLLLL
jgi:hypothetical protein